MKVADVLTWSRFVLYFPITFFAVVGAEVWVLVLYLLAQSTDALDGWVARRTGTASEAGAVLDSRVDTIGIPFSLSWIYFLFPEVYARYWWGIVVVLVFVLLSLLASYWRTGRVTGLHLWSGKAGAILATFLLPVLIVFGDVPWYLLLLLTVSVLQSVEEILFFVLDKQNFDAKSVFE